MGICTKTSVLKLFPFSYPDHELVWRNYRETKVSENVELSTCRVNWLVPCCSNLQFSQSYCSPEPRLCFNLRCLYVLRLNIDMNKIPGLLMGYGDKDPLIYYMISSTLGQTDIGIFDDCSYFYDLEQFGTQLKNKSILIIWEGYKKVTLGLLAKLPLTPTS